MPSVQENSKSKNMDEPIAIIEDLLQAIAKKKQIRDGIKQLNPEWEQLSDENWKRQEACCWIHGATDTYEAIELEKWLYHYPALSITQNSKALNHYKEWEEFIREEGMYTDFNAGDLQEPKLGENLETYIQRHADIVENRGWGNKSEKRALKSFLSYLRNYNHSEEVAFIEHIFPQKSDLRATRIIRKIRPQVHPISQEIVADILKELAHQVVYGRKNASHHAIEALALSWLCLTSSRIRLPKKLEQIHKSQTNIIIFTIEYPELLIPTLFGNLAVRISTRLAKFLQSVAMISSDTPKTTILSTPLPDLRKPFNTAIKRTALPSNLGEITFLTFLSPPHYFGEHIR
jgi:hypothetical protein